MSNRKLMLFSLLLWPAIAWTPSTATTQQDAIDGLPTRPAAFLVRVPLPIDQSSRKKVSGIIDRILERAPVTSRAEDRPLLILQFDTDRGQSGNGSKLEDCLALATQLTSDKLVGVKTVAYIPGMRPGVMNLDPKNDKLAVLSGHAVLVALATEEILIDSKARLGDAFAGELRRDPLTIDIYRNIASRRLTVPLPLALSMIDPTMDLYAVTTNLGEELVTGPKLAELEAAGKVIQKTTLSRSGQTTSYSAMDLEKYSINCHAVQNRGAAATLLKVDLAALDVETASDRAWKALSFELPEFIDSRTVNWGIRALEKRIKSDNFNLVIVTCKDNSGDPTACLKLARYLSGLDPEVVQTASFVEGNLAGTSAIVALACQQVLMQTDASLGGRFEPPIPNDNLGSLIQEVNIIADEREMDPGVFRAMIDLQWQPLHFRNLFSGEVRWMTRDEQSGLPDAEKWQMVGPVDITQPISANDLASLGFARGVLANRDELRVFYQLDSPPIVLKPTRMDRLFDRLAVFLASPFVAVWLLMGAVFLLSTEASTPGVGVPGFLGTLCLVLFFWSQYCDGNATWFEILLFVTGAVFVIVELFVLPGFGIFGIGGLIMMIISIVLATQTFVFPQTEKDFARLPVSLGLVSAAAISLVFALMFLKRYAKDIPYFKAMMLEPPSTAPDFEHSEGEGDMSKWVGRHGVTITRLIPSGKAKIAGKIMDVMTDGAMIDPQTPIEVVEAMGNRIVVQAISKKHA